MGEIFIDKRRTETFKKCTLQVSKELLPRELFLDLDFLVEDVFPVTVSTGRSVKLPVF